MEQNEALWLDGPGTEPRVGPSELPEPDEEGLLLLRVKAVAVQPAEWKVQAGLIPTMQLKYPAVLGIALSGVVEKVGPGVERFQPGDRVLANSTSMLRDDPRFGAYQRFVLAPQALTSKIPDDTSFEAAAALSSSYNAASALFLHLGLERIPVASLTAGPAAQRNEKVLIWGASSAIGSTAVQLAGQAGYSVVGVASARHGDAVKSTFGAAHFVDRAAPDAADQLIALGPFKAVFAAADSAADQETIGKVLAAQGGGHFLSTLGVRRETKLPAGVTGAFAQFLDDYLDPAKADFTRWWWWEYLETALREGKLAPVSVDVQGGLNSVVGAWALLRGDKVSGTRLIIAPE